MPTDDKVCAYNIAVTVTQLLGGAKSQGADTYLKVERATGSGLP